MPDSAKAAGERTCRSITVDRAEIEFSGGFTDLHTRTYEEILSGNGFGLEAIRVSIQSVFGIRRMEPKGLVGEYHPFLKGIA